MDVHLAVSFSLATAGLFLLGGATRQDPPTPFFIRSGDVIVMGGASRLFYHGVPRIMVGDLPAHFTDRNLAAQHYLASFAHDSQCDQRTACDVDVEDVWQKLSGEQENELKLLLDYLSTCRLNINMRQVRDLDALRRQAQAQLNHAAAAPSQSNQYESVSEYP